MRNTFFLLLFDLILINNDLVQLDKHERKETQICIQFYWFGYTSILLDFGYTSTMDAIRNIFESRPLLFKRAGEEAGDTTIGPNSSITNHPKHHYSSCSSPELQDPYLHSHHSSLFSGHHRLNRIIKIVAFILLFLLLNLLLIYLVLIPLTFRASVTIQSELLFLNHIKNDVKEPEHYCLNCTSVLFVDSDQDVKLGEFLITF